MRLTVPSGFLRRKYGLKAFDIIKAAGFDAFDFGSQTTEQDMEEFLSEERWQHVRQIKEHIDNIGLQCAQSHAPFGDDQMALLPAIIRSMEFASHLGAEVIVVHPITDNYHYYERQQELFEENMKFYRLIIPHAQRLNIKVAVENMYGWDNPKRLNIESVCSHSDEFIHYIDTLDSEYIVACVDTGHSLLVGEAPENMITRLGKRVGALHIHDNTGIDDAHNIPFSGVVNWDNVCKALADIGYNGNFTFECGFYRNEMDDEQITHSAEFLAHIGRCLMRKIESYKNN